MSKEKKNPKSSVDDEALSGMTSEFGDIFNEIKQESDSVFENDFEEESSIRGIFGRIKKKNHKEPEKNAIDQTKKISSMKLSESQEILDLSQKVIENNVQDAVVVVAAEEGSNGVTTITMKIPKLTDEKLAELKAEEDKKRIEATQNVDSEKSEKIEDTLKKHETTKIESSDEIENIGDIFKNSETQKSKQTELEQPKLEKNDETNTSQEESSEKKSTSFKVKLSKFFATAKEKAIYYLGFDEDDDYDDDVIYSTSSEIERSKNANPLDFDEEYKENIVYQAPADEKKDDKPDLLKVAAQNTTINQDFELLEEKIDKPEQTIESKSEPDKAEKAVESKSEPDKIEQVVESKSEPDKIEQVVESKSEPDKTEKAVESKSEPDKAEKAVESKSEPDKIEQVVESKSEPDKAEKAIESKSEPDKAEQTIESKSEPDKTEKAVESKSEPTDKNEIDIENLTFDEILAAEKRKQISIDISLDDEDTNEAEVTADSPLYDQLDFSILAEQIAGDVLRETRKPKRTAKPIVNLEVTEQAVESEVKSEVTEQAVESEAKSEVTEQAVESEVKLEVTEQAVESEAKSEVTEQAVESEAKSEVTEQAVESEAKSEVTEQVVEENNTENVDDDLLNPFIHIVDLPRKKSVKIEAKKEVEQLVEVEAKAEVEQPVEIEAKAEVEQPVEVEAKAEVEQPVEVEAKAEVEQPVEIEAKEEVEQSVEIEMKSEVEQSVEIEAKTEVEQSVEVEAKEEVEQPIEVEAKAEVEQPVEVEAKAEVEQSVEVEAKAEVEQPIQNEVDDINPFIKIIDKTRKKPPVAETKTEKFNPVIIQSEKPVQEFRLDFEKGYQEAPKNLLIYKRPSERSNFVVMAGKFTKTVRSEYRAYRYKPKPPEPPETPPTPPKPSQSESVKENLENPFIGDFSFRKRKKKNEQQKEEQTQNTSKTPIHKPTKVKPEPIIKQEKQQIKSEETEVKVPKVKIPKPSFPKPKMPVIPPTVKAAVPSFIRKKQRPEIMPEIKEENFEEEPVQPKPIQKPEPQKEKKPSKVSEAHKAIKKKTQTLKLFSSDEDIDIDDIDGNADKREIEEYENKNEEREIRFEINNNYRKLTIRSIIVSICLVLSVLIDIFVGFMSETFLNMPFGWLLIAFFNALVLCVSVAFCYVPIINGIMPLRHFKGNSDTSIAIASFAGILQSFVSFFTPEMFINGSLHYYTTLIIMALLINCIGRMMIIKRVHDNFKFIMKNPELYAGKIYTDERNAKRMFSGAPLNKPLIAYRKKTNFLSNFLQLSYAPDPSENMAAKIAPITSVIALVGAIIYGIIGGGVSEAVCAFALFAIMLTPVCELIAVNLPIKNLCSAVVKKGSMVTSYESVKQFCDTNAIIIDSNDLYPSGTVTMSGIKTFSGSKVDDAIRGAAAVMLAVKAPMSSMFDNIIKSKRDTLPHVESVIYEDGLGLVGWVAGQRILLGNRRLLDAHGIKVPSVEYEKKYTDKSKQAVYLSLGGELVAMFIVTYKGNSDIAEELRNLEQNGVTLLVRTIDSNITQDRIAEDFGVFYRSVKILPTGLGNITKEITDTPDEETRAYIATKGGIQSFARAISGCIKIKSNVTLSIFIQMVAIVLGFVLVGTITFVSGIARLNILELLIYFAFWIVVTIIAPAIRKP